MKGAGLNGERDEMGPIDYLIVEWPAASRTVRPRRT